MEIVTGQNGIPNLTAAPVSAIGEGLSCTTMYIIVILS
jgi:hypothetical protein